MSTAKNKELMQEIFSGLSQGNSKLFVESMADDFRWTITGTTKWSKTYDGKQAVLTELFGAMRSRLADKIMTTGHRFIADGEHVVVEARGHNTTRSGIPYNNAYCFVFRLAEGKLREVIEYLDTELVTAALGNPEPDGL
jgi:ketosteroid isomerase-like protein